MCDPKHARETLGIRVAVCQSLCLPGDEEGNLHRIALGVSRARAERAQLACFPETAILGWVNPDAHRRAGPIPGPWSEHLCKLARDFGIMVAIGLAEKEGDLLYDSAILIGSQGDILLRHRKINTLAHLLDPPYARGRPEDIGAAETEFGKVAMLICADTFLDELLRRVAALEPDLLLVPYGWAAQAHAWPEHGENLARTVTNAARAVHCPVVGTDCVGIIAHGPWTGQTFGGQSVVSSAAGVVLAIAKDREPDVMIVDL